MNKLYVITGPAGVGKSTVSKSIAEKLDKSALIEGDFIYHQVVGGYVNAWKEGNHLNIFWDNCIDLIKNYLDNDYDVVFNYIIDKKDIGRIRREFKDVEIKFVVLLTDEETLLKRDKQRDIDCQMNERCITLLNSFKNKNYDNKYILDTSNLNIEDTVNTILGEKRFKIDRMTLESIKSPQDIMDYLDDHIEYGWIDIYGTKHIMSMKNYRRLYKTTSIEKTIEEGLGTCVEQVNLTNYLLTKLNIKSHMYCCRIYEGEDFNNLDEDEHMHCFILYEYNDKIYHLEHPNFYNIGIFEYDSIDSAIKEITNYYEKLSGGVKRPTTEYFEVKENMTFKEFNIYINSLEEINILESKK